MDTILAGLAAVLPNLPHVLQELAPGVVMCTLPELDGLPFTIANDEGPSTLAEVFESQGRTEAAAALRRTRSERAGTLPLRVDPPPARDTGGGSSQVSRASEQVT